MPLVSAEHKAFGLSPSPSESYCQKQADSTKFSNRNLIQNGDNVALSLNQFAQQCTIFVSLILVRYGTSLHIHFNFGAETRSQSGEIILIILAKVPSQVCGHCVHNLQWQVSHEYTFLS